MANPPPKNPLLSLQNSKLLKYLLLFALGWCLAQVLAYFSTVITFVVFASILAFLLNYPVTWLQRRMPRFVAVVVVMLVGLLIIGGAGITLGISLVTQAKQMLNNVPQEFDWLEYLQSYLTQFNIVVEVEVLEAQIRQQALNILGLGVNAIQQVLGNIVNLILILVITFFMLLDGERPWQFLVSLLPESLQERLPQAIRRNFIGFFWGQFIISFIFAVVVLIVFLVLQIPYSLVLAAIVGFFDLIPGIGATLGVLLIALIVLPQGLWLSVQVIIICIILQQLQDNILMPRIMKGSVNLNPVVLFVSLLIGATLAGLLGVFLAIPVTGTLVSLFDLKQLQGE